MQSLYIKYMIKIEAFLSRFSNNIYLQKKSIFSKLVVKIGDILKK